MGISGLLPFLEASSRTIHISEFKGCTVAIDSYCWLHKGAFGCCEKLARGENTDAYVMYCLKYIRLLQNYRIKPIMVFDGQHLPAKLQTEKKRRESRNFARKRAAELLRLDKPDEARNYLRQCIDVTHEMALALIKECRKIGVDCIVAPYEADAQLAYLNIQKIADIVITEDSDLVLFGCDRIIFKLDISGNGRLIEAEKLYLSMKMRPDSYTFDKFRYMCILSGCDYLQSLSGIGLKKAQKFIKLTANPDIQSALQKLPLYLNMRQLNVTDEYKEEFMVADATFRHQVVYDPLKRRLVRLTDPEECGTKLDYCRNAGEFYDDERAFQLALGNLDPFTLKKVDNWSPDKPEISRLCNSNNSIWSRNYKKPSGIAVKEPKESIRSTKNVSVNVNTSIIRKSEISQEQAEFDENLAAQMKTYLVTEVTNVTVDEASNASPQVTKETSDDTSPVLNRTEYNPFIKKPLKLSKFPRTILQSNHVVKSRFFQKSVNEQAVINSEEDLEDTSCFTNVSPAKEPHPKKFKMISEETEPEESFSNSACKNIELREHHKPLTTLENKTCDIKMTLSQFSVVKKSKIRSDSVLISDDECDSPIENLTPSSDAYASETDFASQSSSGSLNSVRNRTFTSQEVHKKRLTTCRPVGLQRKTKKPLSKNQPTLLSMFSSMKK